MSEVPYNPLDKLQLARSVADALLERPVTPLPPPVQFYGAGIYAIYYCGPFPAYAPITTEECRVPIYVGKAVPKGGRRGGIDLGSAPTSALHHRLVEHAVSIQQATNLNIEDFKCRYLVVDDIWIPLGEQLLITRFVPVWNRVVDGFGNHDQGATRVTQKRSPWDTIHPGRLWAMRHEIPQRPESAVLESIAEHFREVMGG